mgnify:CR=1 FL=1
MDKLISFCLTVIVIVSIAISINNVTKVKPSDKVEVSKVILDGIF